MVSSARTFVIAEYLKERNLEHLFLVGIRGLREEQSVFKRRNN